MSEVRDCFTCFNVDQLPGVKCCFNCTRDPNSCDVTHICGEDCPGWATKTRGKRQTMRLIDADKIVFDYSGLAYIPPHDYTAIAKYFLEQIKAMPTIVFHPNEPLTLNELREIDGEPVWDTQWNVWGLLDIGLCRVFTRNGDIDLNMALIEQRLYRYKPLE